jgi:flagellar biosynthesis/type III secretory pathway protein FliH
VYPSAAPKIEPDEVAESIVRVQEEILQNLSRAIRDVHVLGSSLRSELEEQLVLLAAKMAQRVIRRELSVDPSILAQLAREGIQALGDRQDVVIRIGRLPDRAQTDSLVQRIRDEYPETRIFIDDHRAPGACVVEAQMGRVDESLETRLDNVLQDVLGAHIDVVGSEI